MKFRCEREVLADALATAGRAATSRTGTLPVLSGLRLEVIGDELSVTGTDLELSIRLTIAVGGERDGAVVVPARLVADIVRALPSGAVEVALADEPHADTVSISAGRSQFAIRPLGLDDYPMQAEPAAEAVTLASSSVAEALRQVVRAASTDDARAVLTGVLIAAEDDGVRMVATDSYRLAVRDLPETDLLAGGQKVLVPSRALNELQRVLGSKRRADGPARGTRRGLRVRGDAIDDEVDRGGVPELPQPAAVLVPEHVDGWPRGPARGAAPGEDLGPGRHTCAPGAGRRDAGADGDHPGRGQRHGGDRRQLHGDGDDRGLQPGLPRRGVDAVDAEEVTLSTLDPMKPAVIRAVGRDDYLYLLMPVRVP